MTMRDKNYIIEKRLAVKTGLLILSVFILLVFFSSLSAIRENHYPLDTLYHRPEDILPTLNELVDLAPDLVSWEVLGHSNNEKLPIYAINITNSRTGSKGSKPSVLFHGQHHGEEPVGVEIIFFMSRHFVDEYGQNPKITYLVDNYDFWFIPTINPEGFRIVNTGIYRLKRKNNIDTSMSGELDLLEDGVDLNRNYPFNWEESESDDPVSPNFKGFKPASENEIRTMIEFYAREEFQLAFFYHSSASGTYSEKIYFPWRWNDEVSPDYNEMLYLGEFLAGHLPRAYEDGNYLVHQGNTSRHAFARDYIYSQHGTLAMLIEVGGNSPNGEGIINPPNELLRSFKRIHTDAMVELLTEYEKDLLVGRVVDIHGTPLSDVDILFDDKNSPYNTNPLTNREGFFFYYLMPGQQLYNLGIEDHQFTILKEDEKRTELTFNLNREAKVPFLEEPLLAGHAIIMTNPVFQYFPPLQIRSEWETEVNEIYISLLKEQEMLYRQAVRSESKQFNLPWIPANLTGNGLLTFQYRDLYPAQDKEKFYNKIIFLNEEKEVLTFVPNHDRHVSWYLQPQTKVGIDYSLYPAGENDFIIDEIVVHGNEAFRSEDLELILYSGSEELHNTGEFDSHDEAVVFTVPGILLPDDLFLVLINNGEQPLSIYQEKGAHYTSRRMMFHYSQWQDTEQRDLAIEVRLKKE